MITAQRMDYRHIDTVTGYLVKIPNTPPGSTFLMNFGKHDYFRVFSVDTGCWVSGGGREIDAIKQSSARFMEYAAHPEGNNWWAAQCNLFTRYLACIWARYETYHYGCLITPNNTPAHPKNQ